MVNGALVKRRLLEKNMSPEKLAASLNCSMSTVRNMLLGKRVNIKTAFKTADILELDVRELEPETVEIFDCLPVTKTEHNN